MHITRTNPEPTITKIDIKAEPSELIKSKQIVLKRLAPQVKVPGFRNGNVPLNILEKHVNPNTLQSEVIEEAVSILYSSAIRQESLRPVANPEISISKFVPFTTLEFTAVIPTLGQIKLADYKKIKAVRKPVNISPKDVDEVIKSLQSRAADRKPVTRASKEGDQIIIDFKGSDSKGQPVQGADSTDYPLQLGSNSFIPGFEANLLELKAGETKSFTLTFPKDYGVQALRNKKVTFEVKIKTVNELTLPKLDDAFAGAVGPFKDMTELRADIKKQIEIERSRENETAYENELIESIANKSVIEIPDMLIEEQIDRIENEEKQNLTYRGVTFEEHLAEEGISPEEHRVQKRPAAEQRVKIGILLSEIAEKEQISASPEEIEVRLQLMKAQFQDPTAKAELAKPEVLRDINARLVTEKTLDKIKNYVGK
jgi:trigger factor